MILKQLLITGFLCYLLGCVSTDLDSEDVPQAAASSRSDCISKGSIRDYKVLDDANLIVTEGGNRKYHMELARRAHTLRSSHSIGFKSRSSRICGGFDDLVIDEGFSRPDTIRIASVRRLTKEQEEELLIRFGLAEPEFEQPRQPAEVEGAEVEELD